MTFDADLKKDIYRYSDEKATAAGVKYLSFSLDSSREVARNYKKKVKDIEILALRDNIIPERYQRNIGTIGAKGQLKLLLSAVAVIGLGGLGGLASQLFARMGIGRLIIVDGDNFADSNLNRQIFAHGLNIGKNKTVVARETIQQINEATEIISFDDYAHEGNLKDLLKEADIAVDCLDNLATRFALQEACTEKGIPMIHGAVAGYIGQIAVIYPGEDLLRSVYGITGEEGDTTVKTDRGIETEMGNPAATPALVASWQVSEAVKILTRKDGLLSRELLCIDLLNNEIHRIPLYATPNS